MNTIGRILCVTAAATLLVIAAGCGERTPSDLPQARAEIDPVVFEDGDGWDEDIYFQPFFRTHYRAVSVDSVFAYDGFTYDGARSLKFNIPPANSAQGPYTGGVITPVAPRDLQDFNALTFYARANRDIAVDVIGFGNDNTGNSLYEASLSPLTRVQLTGDWGFFIVPIPAPSRLIAERGLFTIAEAREAAHVEGYDIWIDEMKYAKLSNIEFYQARMSSVSQPYFVGSTVDIQGTNTRFIVNGAFVIVEHSPGYFDFVSTNPSVAVVEEGKVQIVGEGTAEISGTVENFYDSGNPHPITDTLELTGYALPDQPADLPTWPASDVVSLFSSVYPDISVETWNADWSTAGYQELVVDGRVLKMFSNLGYSSILYHDSPVNTTDLTHCHLDVYAPAGSQITIKLAAEPLPDWGFPNNEPPQVFIHLDSASLPAFVAGQWSSLDIPLADFQYVYHTTPQDFDWTKLNEMVISTGPIPDLQLVLVDNVLFRK